jgi:hypothetical protein
MGAALEVHDRNVPAASFAVHCKLLPPALEVTAHRIHWFVSAERRAVFSVPDADPLVAVPERRTSA